MKNFILGVAVGALGMGLYSGSIKITVPKPEDDNVEYRGIGDPGEKSS